MEGAHELGEATWPDVADRVDRALLVPVGSCEQHGPHLPLDTDARIAVAIARRVAQDRGDTVVAPVVAYGASGEHQAFPGTLSIGAEVLTSVLVELGRSAFPAGPRPHGALVFVNGHGGNAWAVQRAAEVLVGEDRPVSWWAPRIPGGDAHAGRTETSLVLAIAPELVAVARPVGNTEPVEELIDAMRLGGVGAVSDNGVLGDATGASADEGRELIDDLVADLDRTVRRALTGS